MYKKYIANDQKGPVLESSEDTMNESGDRRPEINMVIIFETVGLFCVRRHENSAAESCERDST